VTGIELRRSTVVWKKGTR